MVLAEKVPEEKSKNTKTLATVEDYEEYIKEIGPLNSFGLKAQWLTAEYYNRQISKDLKNCNVAIQEYSKVVENFDKTQNSINRILFLQNYLHADESFFQIGNIYFYELLNMEKSLEIFKQFINKYPNSEILKDAQYKIYLIENNADFNFLPLRKFANAEKYAYQNKFEDAISALDRIIIEYPDCRLKDDVLLKIGNIYQLNLKNYNKAIFTYQRLIDEHKESDLLVKCYNYQGTCYMALKNWEAAENCYRIILSISDSDVTKSYAMYQIGICYENMNNLEESIKIYRELIEKYLKNVWSRAAEIRMKDTLDKLSSKDVKWLDTIRNNKREKK